MTAPELTLTAEHWRIAADAVTGQPSEALQVAAVARAIADAEQRGAQTAGTGGGHGEDADRSGHHEHVDTRDNVVDVDVIGAYGLEYDGPTCVGDDCRVPVDNDGELCEECGDNPHEFVHDGDPRFPNSCACGRHAAARIHDEDEGPEQ